MIAAVLRVVARRAASVEDREAKVVVDPLDARDRDWVAVEDLLPARDSATAALRGAVARDGGPGIKLVKHLRRERRAGAVVAREDVVPTEVELLLRESDGSALGATRGEILRGEVVDLGEEERPFEGHDVRLLGGD